MGCLVWDCVEEILRFVSQNSLSLFIALIIAILITIIMVLCRSKYCKISRKIRWWSRYSIFFEIIILGIKLLFVIFVLTLIMTALGCSPIQCPGLNTLSFNASNNTPDIVGWLTVILTAIIGYLGYKINNSQKKQEETQIMEEVYHNIIEEAKEHWNKFRFSKYITALNRLGYYVYRGTLDPRIIEEQFAMWILRNHKQLIQDYMYLTMEELKCINPDKKDKIGYAKRFYWLLVAISLVYLDKDWNKELEKIAKKADKKDKPHRLIISENCIAPDVEAWLKRRCYWELPKYKIKMQTREEA